MRPAGQLAIAQEAAARAAVKALRASLASAVLEKLAPDLIILDEFQRFHNLLRPSTNLDGRSAAPHLLENWFFGTGYQSRVPLLLLSATPYRLYSGPNEDPAGTKHLKEFFAIMRFLRAVKADDAWLRQLDAQLQGFS